MGLTIVFTIAGYTFVFSVGFRRTSTKWDTEEWIESLLDGEVSQVYGTMDEDGNFVPEGVEITDPDSSNA